ncbi:MAG: hypothetical protein FWG40_06825 [Peptococcaceae bacterium]|nr:hypothetical protein [Peptococcaceae bacterium]
MKKSGITGVTWNTHRSKWQSHISLNKKTYNLGFYTDVEEARLAREQAEAKIADGSFIDWFKNRVKTTRYEDLTGQTFNRLTALYREHRDGRPYWVCKCECGNETYVNAGALKNGGVKSCGCLVPVREDLCGRRFGRLIVLEKTEKRTKDHCIIWKCQCDCGKIVEATRQILCKGYKKSCGCWNESVKYVGGTNAAFLKSEQLSRRNTSGVKGVSWVERSGKWKARITFKRKFYSLGCYDDINDAIKARKQAEEQLYRPFLEWHEAYVEAVMKGEPPPEEPDIQFTR